MDVGLTGKTQMVVDARRQFLLVVCHHDQRLVIPPAESLDDVLHQSAVGIVESMQRFVED